jgi:hypothetical protein
LIDASPDFNWKTELAVAGMEDGRNYLLSASRKMLMQHQHRWANLQWTKELRDNVFSHTWDFQGNIFAFASGDKRSIRFKQLPSESRNIAERDWVVDARKLRMKDFTMDSGQDLLVLVEYPLQ